MSSTEEETRSQATTPPDDPEDHQSTALELEKIEEEKLKSKYPLRLGRPGGILLKKYQIVKFFDSGDYQMAKQKRNGGGLDFANQTGNIIPTPDTVRKTSYVPPSNISISKQ